MKQCLLSRQIYTLVYVVAVRYGNMYDEAKAYLQRPSLQFEGFRNNVRASLREEVKEIDEHLLSR